MPIGTDLQPSVDMSQKIVSRFPVRFPLASTPPLTPPRTMKRSIPYRLCGRGDGPFAALTTLPCQKGNHSRQEDSGATPGDVLELARGMLDGGCTGGASDAENGEQHCAGRTTIVSTNTGVWQRGSRGRGIATGSRRRYFGVAPCTPAKAAVPPSTLAEIAAATSDRFSVPVLPIGKASPYIPIYRSFATWPPIAAHVQHHCSSQK